MENSIIFLYIFENLPLWVCSWLILVCTSDNSFLSWRWAQDSRTLSPVCTHQFSECCRIHLEPMNNEFIIFLRMFVMKTHHRGCSHASGSLFSWWRRLWFVGWRNWVHIHPDKKLNFETVSYTLHGPNG